VTTSRQLEVALALGLAVAVEEQFLDTTRVHGRRARPATEQRVLPAGDVAAIIGKGPVGGRVSPIVLLDARLHLSEQRLTQARLGRHHGFGMGVFRLQIGADVGIEQGRIAHDLTPTQIL
jgi:hypothetical protein